MNHAETIHSIRQRIGYEGVGFNAEEVAVLLQNRDSLEAALYIAREGERIVKERLSSVSEQLIVAKKEIRSLEGQIAELQHEESV